MTDSKVPDVPLSSDGYLVPSEAVEVAYEIKKSRFIARAVAAASREDAMAVLDKARRDYPDARHHCWAYLIGSPKSPTTVAFSDDGEPSGTAGKPILNVLQHKNIGNVMLVVIRYFGGIKLGAGGLVRSYSHAAQMAMEELPSCRYQPLFETRVELDFSQEQALRHWLKNNQGEVLAVDYQQKVTVTAAIPGEVLGELMDFLAGRDARIIDPV